jgi:hypothetical protein
MGDEEKDGGRQFAGLVVFRVQIVAIVAFAISVIFAVLAFERSAEFSVGAGLMMIASALAFGMLANAVLRR